jgi:hypothetical protein
MMVVVPAFSATEQSQDETIPAPVAGIIANSTDDVRQGID